MTENKSTRSGNGIAMGAAFGIVFGAAYGASSGNPSFGVAMGLAIGVAVGAIFNAIKNKKNASLLRHHGQMPATIPSHTSICCANLI